ncbi:hypothetical protein [Streptomyces sp. SID11385]|uniref:hypothetical protein n=1 Tax=Streptomyces sp. SID11385 TaxID=2706031 RepID=UPI0013CDC697|nr:hypothetical protein [Streptomyces sp. SID11385]NEA42050.1 hypothetical protein [Streptomyces sp. SID11385]
MAPQPSPAVPAGRPAAELMTPTALSSLQAGRLSSARSLVNRMLREKWRVERRSLTVEEDGSGEAVYRIHTADRVMDFVAFAFPPSSQERTLRIFDLGWDMMGALLDGPAMAEDIEHTRNEMPRLYHGRATAHTLTWCRANRSLRVFAHVVEALAAGRQPDTVALARVGYLMRNIGLDGNGTFGTRTFLAYGEDHPLAVPYHAQLLSAYMMRELSADLVEALAARRSDTAAALDPRVRRFLGVGNSSALGLVLWVGNHPVLVDRWIMLRERALAHARGLSAAPGTAVRDTLVALLERAALYHSEDVNEYSCFTPAERIVADLRRVHAAIPGRAAAAAAEGRVPTVAELVDGVEAVCDEAAEVVNSVLTELDPEESDRLAAGLTVDETFRRDGSAAVGELRALLAERYAWALAVDRSAPGAVANTWYKSRSAEEPRCGATSELPEGTIDLTVDVPGMVQHLDGVLAAEDPALPVGRLLARRPELRGAVERLQSLAGHAYAVPHANIRDAAFVPARIIRLANAALYGLERTKDYLGRDLRGVIFQGAPTAADLGTDAAGPWFWPAVPRPADSLVLEAPVPAPSNGAAR